MQQETDDVFSRFDLSKKRRGALDRDDLRDIRELDISGDWDYGEFRSINHWIACRFEISWIDAKRRVDASRVIEDLPLISTALEEGRISLDKTVQLTRFATPETEKKLLKWAKTVSLKCVRETADAAQARSLEDVCDTDRLRNFGWRKIEGGAAVSFYGALPAEQGAVVATAIDRIAESMKEAPHEEIPDLFPEEMPSTLAGRRANSLILMASHELSTDFDADRATLVIHAKAESLASDDIPSELQGGSLLHPETVRRLSCDARIQTVLEDGTGEPIGIGRVSRVVPPWLVRLVKHRDRCCTFPGCEDMHYNEAHHIWHWSKGGPTDLDNLILVCGFHHKAVHEYGWSVVKRKDGIIEWFRPSGRSHGVRFPRPDVSDRDPPPPEKCEQQELVPV